MAIRKTDGPVINDRPIICWRNVVTATNVDAESDPDFPITNIANPSTSLKWKHDYTDSPAASLEYITIDTTQALVNYVAIAGHNFATAGIAVGLELQSWNSPIGGDELLFEPQIPADDGPLIFLFEGTNVSGDSPGPAEVEGIRIVFVPSATPAEIAVVYAGEYTELPEGIQGDHTPLPLSVSREVIAGKSENGAFLGRVTLTEGLASTATISNVDQDYFRDQMVPFFDFASEDPFFWCWRPRRFPNEVAFAWLENDPSPSTDIDGYVSFDLDMRGLNA